MNRCVNLAVLAAALAGTLAAAPAFGQSRGRTDGPEGSEVGKGGYEGAGGAGDFSVEASWGAAVSSAPCCKGPPLFAGGALAWWMDDWLQVEASGYYVWRHEGTTLLIGPRFRTPTWRYPVSLTAGLKAGGMWVGGRTVRFALSPQIGGDILLRDHVLLGLGYAFDIPIELDADTHRIFLTAGYRF